MANSNNTHRKKDSARLVWDTKTRRAPNPKDIEFQTAEVVIPNPQYAEQLPLSFRDGLLGEQDIDKQKMNRLIWGDNLLAMQALLAQGYEGKINLIYIDPPFDSKADYSHKMTIEGNEFTKEPSVIERLAYKDTWAGGTDSYLDMLYPRLQLMKRLLAEDGSIYVHCDWHANSYIRIIMDEVFVKENFRSEIIFKRTGGHHLAKGLDVMTDSILWYSRGENCVFHQQYEKLSTEELEEKFPFIEKETGRRFTHEKLEKSSNAYSKGEVRMIQGKKVVSKIGWIWTQETFDERLKKNPYLIFWTDTGRPRYKRYTDEYEGRKVGNLWDDITLIYSNSLEDLEYDTQKPKNLIERIINQSSDDKNIIADFFCGSGTTLAVAEKLGRRWIGCELGKVGIQVTRARLVEQQAKPFLIENIGNYQREMIYLTGGRIWEMQHLILKLYGATPRDKTSGLGVRYLTPDPSPAQERGADRRGEESTPDLPRVRGIGQEVFAMARELRKKQTPAEIILWECLRDRRLAGLKFKRQHPIGKFIADFYCHEAGLVIEVDGVIHQEQSQAERDRLRSEIINTYGLHVLHINNDEIQTNIEKTLEKIVDESITHSPSPAQERGADRRGEVELVYVGYPDRPVTAKKAEELAVQAQKLDGTGYKRLVILGWDYEYNYHQALESRRSALKDKLKVHIESRDIPPDIYDYLKKAKSEEDIESLADKVYFYERPYLRLTEPTLQDLGNGKIQIELGIKRYVLMDIPVGHTSMKDQETYTALMKLAKDNFAVLIDYWAVDWDFDGFTFKSQWQAFRGNGKKAKTVPIIATEILDKKGKRTIAVRVVDIFGNDAGATVEV